MDKYIVSARKYRPSTFDAVVGQSALTTTLKNAISSGKLAHAYLFCGPRGVGKTTCARIFAKTINCLHRTTDGEACNECESCQAFNEQRSFNIHELDAASNNSVEDIRSLIEQVRIQPQVGRYKVFIIDEVHMLSMAAFNAFLKTLEEPPAHAIFILATTEKHKILPTILSRCQIYDFHRMSIGDIVGHLRMVATSEGVAYEDAALNIIAQKADGGMRDALSIFDQEVSFTNGQITYASVLENLNVLDYDYYFRLTDAFLEHRISDILLTFNEILNKGFDGGHFINGLASHFRDLLVSRDVATLPLLEVSDDIRNRYCEQAKRCQPKFVYQALKLCNTCDLNYKTSRNKRLQVELTLIEIAQAASDEPAGLGPAKRLSPIFNNNKQQDIPAAASQTGNPPSGSKTVYTQNNTSPQVATPQNTHAVQPVTPVASPSPATSKPLTVGRFGTPSIRIRPANQPTQTKSVESESTTVKDKEVEIGTNPFEEKDLHYYWYQFANQLPQEEKAIAGRMKNMTPHLIGEAVFEVTVDNEQVEEYLKPLVPHIEQFLRQRINNRNITMKTRVAAPEEQTRVYSKKEQLQFMEEKNRSLVKLQERMGLDFA